MPRSSDASETRHWNSRGQHPRYCTQFLTPHRIPHRSLGGLRRALKKDCCNVTDGAKLLCASRETY